MGVPLLKTINVRMRLCQGVDLYKGRGPVGLGNSLQNCLDGFDSHLPLKYSPIVQWLGHTAYTHVIQVRVLVNPQIKIILYNNIINIT